MPYSQPHQPPQILDAPPPRIGPSHTVGLARHYLAQAYWGNGKCPRRKNIQFLFETSPGGQQVSAFRAKTFFVDRSGVPYNLVAGREKP
jgi:hypothetical protein